MRPATLLAAALLGGASPALATGTILCRSAEDEGLRLYLVVGHNAVSTVVQARLLIRGVEQFTTGADAAAPRIAQAWVDREELKLDIVDANAETIVARVVARHQRGLLYAGTVRYRARIWRVACSEEG